MSGEAGGLAYVITLRSERPIEGCELTPNAFLQLKGGNLDNSARAKLLDSKPFQYVFSWSRGPRGRLCGNTNCPRGNSYDPVAWSKSQLCGAQVLCNVCLSAGKQGSDISFCSTRCFKEAWHSHSQTHSRLKFVINANKDSEPLSPLSPMFEDVGASGSTGNSLLAESNCLECNWVKVSQDKTYTPTSDDIGCRLRIEVRAVALEDGEVLAGPIATFTEAVLQAPHAPPKRNLIAIPGAAGAGAAGAIRFRLVSYNILAELYATKQQYPYCDSWSLSWPYRRALLLRELEDAQGDVVCLQEVQADYYEQHISPFMNELGYDGMFKQKSRDHAGGYVKVDGCATFWRRNKFILVENYSIEFNDIARQEVGRLGLDDSEARKFMNRLSRDNVAQIIVLEALRPVRPGTAPAGRMNICVANTHLYSNVQRADVKLWQTVNLMRELRQFVTQRDVPLLLCGDFNSEPESAVYEYLMTGMIQTDRPELSQYNGGDAGNVRILPDLHHLSHDLALTSALHTALGDEPLFTNYTGKFKGTLDYIFYSHTRMRIMAVSAIPEESEIQATSGEGLPSASYPSDHISLCCDIALVPSGTGSLLSSEHVGVSRIPNIPSMMRSHSSTSNLTLSAAGSGAFPAGPAATLGLLRAHSSTSNLVSGVSQPMVGARTAGASRK